MAKFIDVYCPKCNRKVMSVTDRTENNLSAKCIKCEKLVTYCGKNKKVLINEMPLRKTSSGTRFY